MSSEEDSTESKNFISGVVRELALTGLATYFMTEESVKKYLKDLKIPKELKSFILDGALKKKDDFYGVLSKEVGKFLSKVDLSSEMAKYLSDHNIEVSAKISFSPKKES